MALFIVLEKGTKKSYGVYEVRVDEDPSMKTVTGLPWVHTLFLIYRNDLWEWVPAQEFSPVDMDGLFDE